jgi:CRISPR-associated protein Cmr3
MMQFIFSQLDSWCFREARPMGAVGGTAIESLFPPPASTLIGACRTLIGDSQGVDWAEFAKGNTPEFNALLGTGQHSGQLKFTYPYLRVKEGEVWLKLYPVPSILAQHEQGLCSLFLGLEPVNCDLGNVKLAQFNANIVGAKPLDNCWLTEQGLAECMLGKMPQQKHLVKQDELLQREVRLGIARNNKTATTEDGALYQTEHIRLTQGQRFEQIELIVEVTGLPQHIAESLQQAHTQVRLGGEGRLAHVAVEKAQSTLPKPSLNDKFAIMYCNAPVDLNGWLPSEFKAVEQNSVRRWQANIEGCNVFIDALCAGKPLKLGGWDSALRQPKPVKSLVPAGACFFIESDNLEKLQQSLVTYRFGAQTDFGFGASMLLPAKLK